MITEPVNDPTFAPDFPVTVAAIKKYQSSISKSGINKWLVVKDGSEDAIRFAFPVFVEKDPAAGIPHFNLFTTILQLVLLDQTTNIRSWPVCTEARDELAAIVNSHSVRVFHVFDTDHSLLDPVDIPNKLRGAIVECSTRILHFPFDENDSFVGEIMQVVILRPKPVQPPSPYKKSPTKPYRPAAMSLADVHAQQQRAVDLFTPPSPRQASDEPEGSNPKPAKAKDSDELEDHLASKDNLGKSGSSSGNSIASGSSNRSST
ncbi:hypothetical protein B0H10DRAFT_1994175 [Mycena sp. CBHHK59/15]|nr:hypothetical protein B0H10DRAFT_1994175 [Mycena sp. CBHHK59/15]